MGLGKLLTENSLGRTLHNLTLSLSLGVLIFFAIQANSFADPSLLLSYLFGGSLNLQALTNRKLEGPGPALMTLFSFAPALLYTTNNVFIFCFTILVIEISIYLDQLNVNEKKLSHFDRNKLEFIFKTIVLVSVIALSSIVMSSAEIEASDNFKSLLSPLLPLLFILLSLIYIGVFAPLRNEDWSRFPNISTGIVWLMEVFVPINCVIMAFKLCEKLGYGHYKLALIAVSMILLFAVFLALLRSFGRGLNSKKYYVLYFTLVTGLFIFSTKFSKFEFVCWAVLPYSFIVAPSYFGPKVRKLLGSLVAPGPFSLIYWPLVWEAVGYNGAFSSMLAAFASAHFLLTMINFKLVWGSSEAPFAQNEKIDRTAVILTVFVLVLILVKMRT